MRNFIERYGALSEDAARALGISDQHEILRLQTVCAFLVDNPQLLSWRGSARPDLDALSRSDFDSIARRFFGVRQRRDWPAQPSTVPDEAVSLVLQAVYGYAPPETDRIKIEHQHAMSAENIVGAVLERYIATVLEPHGWVWCAGDFVKAVDFVKYQREAGGWQSVQVKNRDNTENSSSSAIRNGTQIEKWFRSFSRKADTNWEAFPEPAFRNRLSESGFRAFIQQYLRRS